MMVHVASAAVVAMLAYGLDRVTKQLAAAAVPYGSTLELIGPWIRLAHVYNSGTMFGLLPGSAPMLAFVTLPVLAILGWIYLRGAGRSLLALIVLGLVLGASAGNTLDRATSGYVEDFIDLGLHGGPRFWTFNLSDVALVLGIGFAAVRPGANTRRARQQ